MNLQIRKENILKRKKRTRGKIRGTADRPRLCVFRSSKYIYGQLIDDEKGKTLLSAGSREAEAVKGTLSKRTPKPVEGKMAAKVEAAFKTGQLIAQEAVKRKITKVVFDRGAYKYAGRVRALADGAREGGLQF